jgi:XTP/dITP diphosphohydrolase
MKLVFATNNTHKLTEIRAMLPESYELLSLLEAGIKEDPPETHETFQENAMEKAAFIYERCGFPCFADDSGLEVEALGWKPGVFSARYAGADRDSKKNMALLLSEMKGIANRTARFRTVIAYLDHAGPRYFEGIITGSILEHETGEGGFGYDPVFRPDGFQVSFAQMPMNEKNTISHRGKAFRMLINYLSGQSRV